MSKFGGLAGLLFCMALLASSAWAQDRTLALGSQIEDALAPNETHRYSLNALEWTLASFRLEALSDALDPQLAIYDSSGELVIANDDYDYPASRDAIIQAFVFPKSDLYTVAVSGYAASGGAYRLRMLPGYDRQIQAGQKLLLEDWQAVNRLALVRQAGVDRLAVATDGIATTAVVLGNAFAPERDFFFEVQFDNVSSAGDWQVGIAFRYARPDSHSRVLLNKRGFWRMERVEQGDIVVVRNWGTHPAIIPGQTRFRLGVLASGAHFDIVYNGQIVGTLGDSKTEPAGKLGVAMRTANAVDSRLSFAIAQATMTIPTRVDESVLLPSQLLARSYHVMHDVLTRQQLIPIGGDIKMLLPESSVRRRSAGVTPFRLGSGLRFAEFALGAAVSFQMSGEANGGCGILFHYQDQERYQLAYVTAGGDYGLSQRQGDIFAPGIYVKKPPRERQKHDMLLIVHDGTIHYYADKAHIGEIAYDTASGSVGIAAVNYASVDTNCDFADFWVLSLDDLPNLDE